MSSSQMKANKHRSPSLKFFPVNEQILQRKSLENRSDRVQFHLTQSIDETQLMTNISWMKPFKLFSCCGFQACEKAFEQIKYGQCMRPRFIEIHKPSFLYKYLSIAFEGQLIYSDTDSLLYEISHSDNYYQTGDAVPLGKVDNSSHTKNHLLYRYANEMSDIYPKFEVTAKELEEFLVLKPEQSRMF